MAVALPLAPRWWPWRHLPTAVGGLTSLHGRLAQCHARFYAAGAYLCRPRRRFRRYGCFGSTSALASRDAPSTPERFLHSRPEEPRALPPREIPWIAIWCVLLIESGMP